MNYQKVIHRLCVINSISMRFEMKFSILLCIAYAHIHKVIHKNGLSVDKYSSFFQKSQYHERSFVNECG